MHIIPNHKIHNHKNNVFSILSGSIYCKKSQCLLFTIRNFLWIGILLLGTLCFRNFVIRNFVPALLSCLFIQGCIPCFLSLHKLRVLLSLQFILSFSQTLPSSPPITHFFLQFPFSFKLLSFLPPFFFSF